MRSLRYRPNIAAEPSAPAGRAGSACWRSDRGLRSDVHAPLHLRRRRDSPATSWTSSDCPGWPGTPWRRPVTGCRSKGLTRSSASPPHPGGQCPAVRNLQPSSGRGGGRRPLHRTHARPRSHDRVARGRAVRLVGGTVVGFDDLPEAAYFAPPLTTVRQELNEVSCSTRSPTAPSTNSTSSSTHRSSSGGARLPARERGSGPRAGWEGEQRRSCLAGHLSSLGPAAAPSRDRQRGHADIHHHHWAFSFRLNAAHAGQSWGRWSRW